MGLRQNYITKKDAIKFLYGLKEKPVIDLDDLRTIEMLRICLIGDTMKLNLWGKSIEDTRPIFIKSVDDMSSAYQADLKRALAIAKEV